MRKSILVILMTLACIHPFNWHKRVFPRWDGIGHTVYAAVCKYSWKSVAGATSYALEYSSDNGATWVGKKNTGALTPDANGDVAYLYSGVPETGLMLFRVSALNASGSATRTEYGAWYNHLWKPMAAPTGGRITNN